MSLNPRVCKKSYKVHIPMMGEACEFWLITVTDEQSITNPDKDHAYLTDDGKLFVFNGDSLVRVNCDICFTQEEREKLEGIEENANNYTLPEADSNKLGGVILGYTQNGKNYPVVKDSDGKIYVQVPWVDYALPKAEDDQLGGIKTGYKQNGKYYPVKVDTDGNAYVQVPWEDTNTVYEVVSKTSNGLMPMLPSDENASKRFLNGDGEWVVGTDNSINGVTQTGSTFSGETSDCGVQITRVKGKTSQKTTTGINLANYNVSGNNVKVGNVKSGKKYTFFFNQDTSTNFNLFIISNEQNYNLTLEKKDYSSFAKALFTTDRDGALYFNGYSNSANARNFMLVEGDVYDIANTIPFEPYTGGKPAPNPDYPIDIENVEISEIESCGRNLLKLISTLEETTINGVTFKPIYESGYLKCITVNGTATERISYILQDKLELENKSYVLQGCPQGGTTSTYCLICSFYDKSSGSWKDEKYDIGNKLTFNGGNYLTEISILIRKDTVCNNLIFYPMLRNAEDLDTTYEPPKNATVETSLTLAQDDIYQNGTITRDRKQVVFDGSSDEAWTASSNPNTFYTTFSDKTTSETNEIKSNRFVQIEKSISDSNLKNGQLKEDANNPKIVYFKLDEVADLSSFKTWLSTHNTVVEYELATPTTEEYQVPTIPSYYPYTEVSTDSKVEPEITFKPLPYTTCLVGEATEEESGYMPKLSGNASQFLNGQGGWSTPSGYTLPTASTSQLGGVKIGSNISISDGAISIDKDNVTEALGYTPPTTNTTYEKVDKSSDGLCPKLPNETTTTKYLRQDGSWAVPPNTTYGVASTSADGLMSSSDKTKLTNLRRIWKGTSSSPPSGWVDGDIYVQYEE